MTKWNAHDMIPMEIRSYMVKEKYELLNFR